MSALGQKQTSRDIRVMSALPPESGHGLVPLECPLCANSGLMRCNKKKDRLAAVSPKINQVPVSFTLRRARLRASCVAV